ncbi:hypothetical protein OBG92_05754 [Pseudomonas paraeruginosa]|uniref:Fimbrial family protein n=2 Tax=Pseudomonas TaxID=286 RepID=A0A2R3IQL4_9PSED|nr:fimbrial protein [Pseudomonas paraeruginosa]AVK04206.1 fimbrial family protein [Pseudomonas paraeruginosa]AWE94776.1 fimbrial family protein [Pseudomonas paraeruginosa]UYT23520.1 hypothetical protein OBG92_05754 [Pseudomonas aeruginosa]
MSSQPRHRPQSHSPRPLLVAVAGLALLCGTWTSSALGDCIFNSGTNQTSAIISPLPTIIPLKAASIGGVMATAFTEVGRVQWWSCWKAPYGMPALKTGLVPADGFENVYQTGVPGVGIRFGFYASSNWGPTRYPPFEAMITWPSSDPYLMPFPNYMAIEFIRTGMEVGRGTVAPFDLATEFYLGTTPMTHIPITGSNLRTTLVQNIYFTSCHNPYSDPTVDMGRPYAALVKQGQVEERPFSLTIRCDGMNATTKPPVKIYFEGNAVRDGLLRLSDEGQAGVAKGVAIELKNDNGVALPFAKERAVSLAWRNSAPDAEIYGFFGKAKYVATGGEVIPGKADAVLTYVLEYN